jgi:hypothetical protein
VHGLRRVVSIDSSWHAGARLTLTAQVGTTRLWAYRRAARRYWSQALWQRVIGRRQLPTQWDEDELLRCFFEEFDRGIPSAALAAEPIIPRGEWDRAAQQLIDELAGTRLHYPTSLEMRRLLVDAANAELELALGNRSSAALERSKAAVVAIENQWHVLEGSGDQTRRTAARPG